MMIRQDNPWYPPSATREALANAFYRAGIIERWGSGTTNILNWCDENGNPAPHWQERAGSVVVTFLPIPESKTQQVTAEVTMQVTMQVEKMLLSCRQPIGRNELQDRLGFKNRDHFRKSYLLAALNAGWIEMTIPDKPNSRLQKYRLTSAGEKILQEKQKKKGAHVLPSTK